MGFKKGGITVLIERRMVHLLIFFFKLEWEKVGGY